MDVVDTKTSINEHLITVSLTTSDIAALQNGEDLDLRDPETKLLFKVTAGLMADYTIECGPGAGRLLGAMLEGWLTVVGNTGVMYLSGDRGKVTINVLDVGDKTTANTTVTETTMEIVGAVPEKK
jgi:hypothetical protein